MIRIASLAVATTMLAGTFGLAPSAMADEPLPVPEIEKIVRDYLMREPQVIYDGPPDLMEQARDPRVGQFVRGEAGERLMEMRERGLMSEETIKG